MQYFCWELECILLLDVVSFSLCCSGFFAKDGECGECSLPCKTCRKNATACLSCEKPLLLEGFKCKPECSKGYFAADGACEACPQMCQECIHQSKCKGKPRIQWTMYSSINAEPPSECTELSFVLQSLSWHFYLSSTENIITSQWLFNRFRLEEKQWDPIIQNLEVNVENFLIGIPVWRPKKRRMLCSCPSV